MHLILAASSAPSLASLLPRLFASMAIVIGLMWLAARLTKNRGISKGNTTFKIGANKRSPLEVLARQGVGRNATITIVRAGDKALVLGVTESSISVLTELDQLDLGANDTIEMLEPHGTGASVDGRALASGTARTGLLTQIRDLTVRKA